MNGAASSTTEGFRCLVLATVSAVAMMAWPATSCAQEAGGRRPAAGALVGAGVGVATGFVLAGATDYPLKEGGAFVVTFLGAALGAVTGHKLSSSLGRPWSAPGRVQVTFPWAAGWSGAADDIESAFSAHGYRGEDTHHALVPAVTVTLNAFGPLRVGAEVSGIRAVSVGGRGALASLTENVDGRAVAALAVVGKRPTAERRLTWAVGGGIDRYVVTVESYFDQVEEGDRPDAQQPRRSVRSEATGWGPHVRAGAEYHLTRDVSVKLEGMRRWKGDVTVPNIEILDSSGTVLTRHGGHSVSLGSFQMALGVALGF